LFGRRRGFGHIHAMTPQALGSWLQELSAALPRDAGELRLRLLLTTAADGSVRLATAAEAAVAQQVEITLPAAGPAVAAGAAVHPAAAPAAASPCAASVGSAAAGTLRRRLELVLGGPPGFTTGARAEVLADLLRESGPGPILAEIASAWANQFDTGLSADAR
jgi:hypothetical protein